jgi:hypothetical protein
VYNYQYKTIVAHVHGFVSGQLPDKDAIGNVTVTTYNRFQLPIKSLKYGANNMKEINDSNLLSESHIWYNITKPSQGSMSQKANYQLPIQVTNAVYGKDPKTGVQTHRSEKHQFKYNDYGNKTDDYRIKCTKGTDCDIDINKPVDINKIGINTDNATVVTHTYTEYDVPSSGILQQTDSSNHHGLVKWSIVRVARIKAGDNDKTCKTNGKDNYCRDANGKILYESRTVFNILSKDGLATIASIKGIGDPAHGIALTAEAAKAHPEAFTAVSTDANGKSVDIGREQASTFELPNKDAPLTVFHRPLSQAKCYPQPNTSVATDGFLKASADNNYNAYNLCPHQIDKSKRIIVKK